MDDCLLCQSVEADAQLQRVEVWSDSLWRLTMASEGYVPAFGYLEPRRHIPHITDLDGAEAATFGAVLARTASAMRAAAEADVTYVYVFGTGIAHLHVHLAPHVDGDPLSSRILEGEVLEERVPSGATRLTMPGLPEASPETVAAVAEDVRRRLAGWRP